MKTRVTLITVCSMFLFLWMGRIAFAGYPHGDFSSSPDACAACHRMHTATALNLIKDPTGGGVCKTCHSAALGADTDVMNGVYTENKDGEPHHATWGTNNAKLLGGGFNYIQNTSTTTSKHRVDETLVPPGSESGATIELKCTSCHSAHPDRLHPEQYRLLRVRPNSVITDFDVAWNGPWTDATETTTTTDENGYRGYTEIDFSADNPVGVKAPGAAGEKEFTRNYTGPAGTNNTSIAEWCATCHTHYMATYTGGASGTANEYKTGDVYDAGDIYGVLYGGNVIERQRHTVNTPIWNRTAINGMEYDLTTDVPLEDLTANGRTSDDLLTCLSCHKAHGSDATMTGSAVIEDRGDVLPTGVDSMLLRGDTGRRICADCHNF